MTEQIPLKTDKKTFSLWLAHVIAWALENKEKAIGYAVSCTIVVFCSIALFFAKTKDSSKKQFDAQVLAQELVKSRTNETLAQLQKLVQEDPRLQKDYVAVIAQSLLYEQNPEIDPWAEQAVSTLESCKLPLFANFAQVSRLSAKSMFKEALQGSLELKLQLLSADIQEKNSEQFFALRAYNLIETSALCFRCKEKKLMEENIAELKNVLEQPILKNSGSLQKIFRQLHCGPISMMDFLQKQLTELE